MEILRFNIDEPRERVINKMIRAYEDNPQLFEDVCYCHYSIDDDGTVYLYDNTREGDYGDSCSYEYDFDEDTIHDEDIRDCVEYFYDQITLSPEDRAVFRRRRGFPSYMESKKRTRRVRKSMNEAKAKETYCFCLLNEDGKTVDFYPMSLKSINIILKKVGREMFSREGVDWSLWIGRWRDGTENMLGKVAYAAVGKRNPDPGTERYQYFAPIEDFIRQYGDNDTYRFWNSDYRNYYDMDKAETRTESLRRRRRYRR